MKKSKSAPKFGYRKCIICGKGKKEKLSVFHFPTSGNRLKFWLEAVNNPELYKLSLFELSELVICMNHFEENQFTSSLKRRLTKFAIPNKSLLPNKELSEPCTKKIRKEINDDKNSNCNSSLLCHNYAECQKNSMDTEMCSFNAPHNLTEDNIECQQTSFVTEMTKISKENNFSSKNCAQNHDHSYIKNNLPVVIIKQFYYLKSRSAENLLENKSTNQKENDIQNEQNSECQNNLKSTKEEFHRCNICSKEFLSLINVLVHKYRFCKARLTRINFMKRLMKLKPSIKRKYHCNLCKRNLFNESYLRTHLFMHIGKRPFSCKVCFKSFYIKSYLQNHVKIHTKENIFQKKTCERNFNFDSYLNNYEDHSEEYEFFYCHICRKNFQTEIALIIHGINHSEAKFHCDICNKNFQYKSAFVKHQASHYEHRPFSI